jgi:hypothetical protein
MKILTQNDIDRFWGKVDKDSSATFYNGTRCWEWSAGCNGNSSYTLAKEFGVLPSTIWKIVKNKIWKE